MTEDKLIYRLFKGNILFLSVPLCAVLGLIKFDSSYKVLGLCLFICVFCVIYKLYAKITNYKKYKANNSLGNELLTASGFIVTIGFGVLAELPSFRWLFLIGIVLSVIFSDILSALISTFAYVLIITVFTSVPPEFVANSFLTAVILVILTQYYSDFTSVIYSIITVISFEIAFFVIMHGLKTDKLITASHIIEAGIISGCILSGWLLFRYFEKRNTAVEALENTEKTNIEDDSIDVKDVILNNVENLQNTVSEKAVGEKAEAIKIDDKDYSYLLNSNIGLYNKLATNEKVFNEAKRTSKFVKEITELIEGNVSLAEAGAFYAECGRIVSNNYIKEGLILAKENNFPIEVTDFIKEHNFKLGYPKSREAAITMIVCKLSATIAYLQIKGIRRNITQIVDGVMDSCLMAGRLDYCGLSLNEYKFIKDYLLEEARVSYDYFSGE